MSSLTAAQIVAMTLIAGGGATLIGALWYVVTQRNAADPGYAYSTIASLESALSSQQRTNVLLQRRMDQVEHEIDRLREERQIDRTQIAAMQAELDLLYAGVQRLIEQITALGAEPVWHPPRRSPSARINSRAELTKRIIAGFNIEEINGLAFDVGLNEESFAGETAAARARTLVELATRRGLLADLEKRVNELRPAQTGKE